MFLLHLRDIPELEQRLCLDAKECDIFLRAKQRELKQFWVRTEYRFKANSN